MTYYSEPNVFTVITREKWIIPELSYDLDFIFTCIKSILIHPIDTKENKVKYDRAKSGYFHASNNTVDKILSYPGLRAALDKKELPLDTIPQNKAVLSCDHHALLFASFLRNIGINVRVKTGYANYLVPDTLIPHWIAEIYNSEAKKWDLIDPERLIKKITNNQFMFAHQAWAYFLDKDENIIPGYSALPGRQGLKYALICELNCVFKNELLAYEWRLSGSKRKKPEIVHNKYERLTKEQKDDLNRISLLLENPDENINELWSLYNKHQIEPDTVKPVL